MSDQPGLDTWIERLGTRGGPAESRSRGSRRRRGAQARSKRSSRSRASSLRPSASMHSASPWRAQPFSGVACEVRFVDLDGLLEPALLGQGALRARGGRAPSSPRARRSSALRPRRTASRRSSKAASWFPMRYWISPVRTFSATARISETGFWKSIRVAGTASLASRKAASSAFASSTRPRVASATPAGVVPDGAGRQELLGGRGLLEDLLPPAEAHEHVVGSRLEDVEVVGEGREELGRGLLQDLPASTRARRRSARRTSRRRRRSDSCAGDRACRSSGARRAPRRRRRPRRPPGSRGSCPRSAPVHV